MRFLSVLVHLRFFRRHPWQMLLALTGVALGVAVVVAIDLAKSSALISFTQASSAVLGKATHRISADGGIDEAIYYRLRLLGFRKIRPLLQGKVKTIETSQNLILMGVDPLTEAQFSSPWQSADGESKQRIWPKIIIEPGAVVVGQPLAQSLGIGLGDSIQVDVKDQRRWLHVVGILTPKNSVQRQVLENLVVGDISTTQEILGLNGLLSAIDLIIEDQKEIELIQRHLPQDAELLTKEAGSISARHMTRAFYINLTALSLVSLLVGGFLIYNSVSFMSIQRQKLFGILRVLGQTHQQILAQVLLEALVIGVLGSLFGVLVGIMLGSGLLSLLVRTLDAIYFPLPSAELAQSPMILAKGFCLGVIATLAAVLKPAFDASRVKPIVVLARSERERSSRKSALSAFLAGVILVNAGLGIILGIESLIWGFVAITVVVLGCALMIPALSLALLKMAQITGGRVFGVIGKMAPRAVSASLSRTGVAAAALMVAVATTIGMALMIESFRTSVALWLKQRLDADLYVYATDSAGNGRSLLSKRIGDQLKKIPGVASVGNVRYLRQATDQGFLRINIYDLSPQSLASFQFKEGGNTAWQDFQRRDSVIVTESFANLRGLHKDDLLDLPTPLGLQRFSIAAVYVDFNAGQGIVAMSRNTYEKYWNDDSVSTFWVYLKPKAIPNQVKAGILQLAPQAHLEIRDNRELYELSMRIFDQAFAVTEVLRWLATGVAIVGVFSALLALQLERHHEMGVLRALGMTPPQLWGLILAETSLLGLIAGAMAIPSGIMMGWMLSEVINHRAFGWTLTMQVGADPLLRGLVLALVAAFLAGLLPAWKMANTLPAEALRSE